MEIHPVTKTTNVIDSQGKNVDQKIAEITPSSIGAASIDGDYANLRARATTKADVGLSNVINVLQASKVEFDEHVNATYAHGATTVNTPNTLMWRNADGNVQVGNASGGTHAINRDFGDGRYARIDQTNTFSRENTYSQRSTFNNGINIKSSLINSNFDTGRQMLEVRAYTALSNGAGINLYGDSDSTTSAGGMRLYTGGTTSLWISKEGLIDISGDLNVNGNLEVATKVDTPLQPHYNNTVR